MTTPEEIYRHVSAELPARDQLRVVQLILNGVASAPSGFIDAWSDEDIEDLIAAALKRIEVSEPATVRDHSAFLQAFAPEDEGLYDDLEPPRD